MSSSRFANRAKKLSGRLAQQVFRSVPVGLAGASLIVLGVIVLFIAQRAPSADAQQAGTGPRPLTPSPTVPSATPTPTPSDVTPTPTPTASPTTSAVSIAPTLSPGLAERHGIEAVEGLWGLAQACTESLSNAANSIDLAFNDAVASSGSFQNGSTWTYTVIQDMTLGTVVQVSLEVRFYVSGWSNDPISLEVYNGAGWQTVTTFTTSNAPPGTLATLRYDVSGMLTTPGEFNAAQVRFVGDRQASLDGFALHLDEVRFEVSDEAQTPTPMPTLNPMPTPTAPVPAPTNPPIAGDPHVYYAATTSSCAGCHRTHTGQGRALRGAWPEETLCFACHASGGSGTGVEAAFGHTNTATRFFSHDVAATIGVHRIAEAAGSDFGEANRHVECEDCHEPHEATRGAASAPMLQREMHRASGVDPVWTAPGTAQAYNWLPQAEREYQVCFKCHSSFTTLPTYVPDGWDGSSFVPDGLRKLTSSDPQQVPDSRDMAQEFNPYNASFHPVVAQGRNQAMPSGSFVPGWSSTSMIYCSDCHANSYATTEGAGPHGSPRLHLLNGSADYQTARPDDPNSTGTEVCFTCHDAADYVGNSSDTNFRRGNRNLHTRHSDNGSCYLCHDSHGSEQLHLLNLDLSITGSSNTYLLSGYDGLPTNSQTFWQISPDHSEKTCWLVCHNYDHRNRSYSNLGD